MAILEAILTSEYANQLVINRWNYVSSGDAGPVTHSYGLLSAMGFVPPTATPWEFTADTLARYIQYMVSDQLVFKAFYVRDLYDPTDFIETAFNPLTKGGMSGADGSPALAYGLTSSRVRTDIRRGSKRFAGVTEEGMGDGGVVTGTPATWLAAIAGVMSSVLEYDDGGAALSFAPCVLGLEKYTAPSGKPAYRPYATESAQLAHTAQNVVFSPLSYVRTQTSRQYGHGA